MPIKEDRIALRHVIPESVGYVLPGLSSVLHLGLAMFSHRCKRVVFRGHTTRIKTLYETLISIPNSTAVDSNILNYSFLDDPYWTTLRVSIAPIYDPAWVQQILIDAALKVPEILHDPAPMTRFKGQGDSSANFDVWFCVENFGRRSKATAAVWTSIWSLLERAGIKRMILRREILRVDGTGTIKTPKQEALSDE